MTKRCSLSEAVKGALSFSRQEMSRDTRTAEGVIRTSTLEPIVLVPATDDVEKRLISMADEHRDNGRAYNLRFQDRWVSLLNCGMGAPSWEIYLSAARCAGAKSLIRVDFCGGLDQKVSVGDIFVPEVAVSGEHVSKIYMSGETVKADPSLVSQIVECSETVLKEDGSGCQLHRGTIVSTDVFFAQTHSMLENYAERAHAVDMETTFLFAFAKKHSLRSSAILVVSDCKLSGKDTFNLNRIDTNKLVVSMSVLMRIVARLCQADISAGRG